jgi:ATP-dependent Lon protease
MIIIKANNYTIKDKIKLSSDFLIKDIAKSYNFKENEIIIDNENIEYLINKTTTEHGVRNLQRNINNIFSHINLHRYIKIDNELITFPFTITKKFIDKYIIMKKDIEHYNFLYI